MSIDKRPEERREELVEEWKASRLFLGYPNVGHDYFLAHIKAIPNPEQPLELLAIMIASLQEDPKLRIPFFGKIRFAFPRTGEQTETKMSSPLAAITEMMGKFNREQSAINTPALLHYRLKMLKLSGIYQPSEVDLVILSREDTAYLALEDRRWPKAEPVFTGTEAENVLNFVEDIHWSREDLRIAPAPLSRWAHVFRPAS